MRLMVVSARHHPSQGGIGAGVWWLIHHARCAGWEIDLLTRPGTCLPPATRVHLVHTPDMQPEFAQRIGALRQIERIRPYRYGLWALAVAERLMQLEVPADAIEFVDSQAEGFTALTSRLVRERWRNVPMCVHAHAPMFLIERISGMPADRFGRSTYHTWERQALAAADGIIAPSRHMLHTLDLRYPHPPAKAIPYLLPPLDDSDHDMVRSNRTHIALIGNVEPNKGVDIWARSLNRVLRDRSDVCAVLAGPDTPTARGGSSMVAHVQQLIEPDLRQRFQWLGPIDHDRAQQLIRSAQLVVVPSRFESFSFVAAEAIAQRTPVLVCDGVGILDFVPSLPRVPYGQIEALSDMQLRLLDDRQATAESVRRCCAELKNACDPQRTLRSRVEFIERCAARKVAGDWEASSSNPDSIEQMRQFLLETECMERSLPLLQKSAVGVS